MKKLISISILLSFTSLLFISCDSDTLPPEQIVDENNNGFESFEVAEIFAMNHLKLQKFLQVLVQLPAAIPGMIHQTDLHYPATQIC